MKATIEKTEGNVVTLRIEVGAEEFQKAVDKAYRDVAQKVNIPGFRKGKAPKFIVDRYVGTAAVLEEAMDQVAPEAYAKAVEEIGIEPIDRPEIEMEQIEQGKDLIFSARVQVTPEVELADYKSIKIPKEVRKIEDKDVDEYIESLRERRAELVTVEKGTVENGDFAVIDFTGYIGDEPFEGGSAQGYPLEIGSGAFPPGFEDQLVGAKVGETLEVKVKFPEDYRVQDLAGKDARFEVTVKEIKQKRLPELNDEFAKEVAGVESVAELRERVRKVLQDYADEGAERLFREKLVDALVDGSTVNVPEVLVRKEIGEMIHEFEHELEHQHMTLEKYYETVGTTEEGLEESFRGTAERRAKRELVLDAFAKELGGAPSEEEIDQALRALAHATDESFDKFKKMYENRPAFAKDIKKSIARQKALDILAAECVAANGTAGQESATGAGEPAESDGATA